MVDGKNFKESFSEEKAKIKGMTASERVSYFCSYYLKPVLAVSITAAFIIYFLLTIFINSNNDGIEGAMVNLAASENTKLLLTEELEKSILEKNKKAYLEMDMNITFTLEETDQYSYANRMKLMSMVAAGELDYMVLNEEAYENLSKEDMFVNLTQRGVGFNVCDDKAICLSPEEALNKLDITTDANVYICFLVNGAHEDEWNEFIEYLDELGD